MNQKTNIIWVLLLLTFSFINANASGTLCDSAETYYTNGKYQVVIDCYEKIRDTGVESLDLYYNLANAYYKKGDLAMAIVNYERALKLKPSDEDTKFNLRLAQSKIIDKITPMPEFLLTKWYKRCVTSLSLNTWAYFSIASFTLFWIVLLVFIFTSNISIKNLSFKVGFVLLVLTGLTFMSARQFKREQFDKVFAIITTPSVNIKSSPDENSMSLFILHSGTKLQVLDKLESWYEIKIQDGNVGWIKKEDLVKI